MERMFIRRADYPNDFKVPYKWHLVGDEKWLNDSPMRTRCWIYRIEVRWAEYTFFDMEDAKDAEDDGTVCKWCLRLAKDLDASGTPDPIMGKQ